MCIRDRYEGKFKNNEISGYGKYKWKDCTTYKGNVKNGIRHGVGVFKNPKEGYMYDGEWKHGLRHGKGKLQYNYQKEGFEGYDGNWKEGEKCGFGKYVYPSGNIYEGEWEHNKRNGKGTMIWAEDKDKKRPQEKYTGQWKDDLQNGFGTHTWMDTQSENKILRNRYVGYWKNGTREGHGVFFYGNGSKYVGQWKNNMKDGWGKFIYEDGNEFEGCYLKDRIVDSSKISEGKTITAGIQAATDLSNVQHIHEKLEKKSAAKPPAKGEKTIKETIRSPHSTKGKQEVDENPFSKMIDSSDLIAIENLKSKVLSGPPSKGIPGQPGVKQKELQEEINNFILTKTSKIKHWYKVFSNVDPVEFEEGFMMVNRQFWRLLETCKILNVGFSLAQFNRIYLQGKKTFFSLRYTQPDEAELRKELDFRAKTTEEKKTRRQKRGRREIYYHSSAGSGKY
eukprot:TRINITY_DN2662_c0_g1_i1.p1 TRINITY_DN2662_c0_g1~~TRINITY_DN2662_c0_g1_i1.p1  ORF type:complete len:450 (+),score=92.30 TRINITY_DN2662_c0_g1_i1:3-1352(+)